MKDNTNLHIHMNEYMFYEFDSKGYNIFKNTIEVSFLGLGQNPILISYIIRKYPYGHFKPLFRVKHRGVTLTHFKSQKCENRNRLDSLSIPGPALTEHTNMSFACERSLITFKIRGYHNRYLQI